MLKSHTLKTVFYLEIQLFCTMANTVSRFLNSRLSASDEPRFHLAISSMLTHWTVTMSHLSTLTHYYRFCDSPCRDESESLFVWLIKMLAWLIVNYNVSQFWRSASSKWVIFHMTHRKMDQMSQETHQSFCVWEGEETVPPVRIHA